MRRRIERPVVVLPQPDSPTRLKVSPVAMSNETSLTARTWPFVRPKIPRFMGKLFVRLRTETSGVPRSSLRFRSTIAMRSLVSIIQEGSDIRRALRFARQAGDAGGPAVRARLQD